MLDAPKPSFLAYASIRFQGLFCVGRDLSSIDKFFTWFNFFEDFRDADERRRRLMRVCVEWMKLVQPRFDFST